MIVINIIIMDITGIITIVIIKKVINNLKNK